MCTYVEDTTHQHVMALGDFQGGELCTEEEVVVAPPSLPPQQGAKTTPAAGSGGGGGGGDGRRTLRIDVKNRVGRLDGRTVGLLHTILVHDPVTQRLIFILL